MATTTWKATVAADWGDAKNWSAGVPFPGETAVIPDGANVEVGDLGLANETVQLAGQLYGDTLSLANAHIYGVGSGGMEVAELDINSASFVGIQSARAHSLMFITADTIINNGTIGAESGLAFPVEIMPNWNHQAAISNNGTIAAENGGFVVLNATSVTGSGKISLTNGGTVEIAYSNVASTQKIDMGGEQATRLVFDAFSTIAGQISNFSLTDFIDILGFNGTMNYMPGSNPVLRFVGTGYGKPDSFTLSLNGKYGAGAISLHPDSSGLGMTLTTNHT